jgi:hypothetical protein
MNKEILEKYSYLKFTLNKGTFALRGIFAQIFTKSTLMLLLNKLLHLFWQGKNLAG